jgi:hypothetical protein
MKKILSAIMFMLISVNAHSALTDIKFGSQQVADSQWNVNACLTTTTCQIYSKNPGTMYKIPWTSGTWQWQAGQYVQFVLTGNSTNPYEGKVYNSNGSDAGTIGTGKIVNMGPDYFFFVGNDNNTGQLFSGSTGMSNTSGVSWTGTLNPTISQADAYANATYSSVPLSSGQTATVTPNSTTTQPVAPTNLGFESGNTTSWTISNTSGAANWNAGSGASVVTGLQHTPGGGKSWAVSPYGTYMLSVQPGSGSPTFDSMTSSLGLSAAQNTAIKNLLTQQAQTSGGNPTPTNASWVKREISLQSGVTYSIAWQYLSTDYTPFNDGSIITLVHKTDSSKVPTLNNSQRNYSLLGFTNPGTGDYSTNSYGATGWQIATFTVPTDGEYTLGFASFNLGDTALSPILLIDEMQGTTLLNGQTFTPVSPNPGTGAPAAGGGGSAPAWPSTSDFTSAQLSQKNSAKSRVANVQLGNRLYLEQKSGSSNNSVTIEQTGFYNSIVGLGGSEYAIVNGSSNTLNIKQGDGVGRNLIEFSITGNSNSVTLWQARSLTTGLQDGSESGGHYTGVNVVGSSNTVSVKQGNNGGVSSGHVAFMDVAGNGNTGSLRQSNDGEKVFFGVVGGSNTVFDIQQGGTVAQYFDLMLSGNGHSVTANQKDGGAHKATVNLTNSGGASTVTLVQQGSTAQNINITQQCATLSGCSVTVTQGQ